MKFFSRKYFTITFGIQMIVDCSKDERLSKCLPSIITTTAEICTPTDKGRKGINLYCDEILYTDKQLNDKQYLFDFTCIYL